MTQVTINRELDKNERVGGDYVKGLKQFECTCECGSLFVVTSRSLKINKVSCCSDCTSRNRSDLVKTVHTKHGKCGTRIYRCWQAMKTRCDNTNGEYYQHYGGRGISYVEEWSDFSKFYEDMKDTYQDNLELERINVNEGYSKANCEWATESLQGYNQRQRVTNTSGRTGVYRTVDGKWWAEIQDKGITSYLGRYKTFEEACVARKLAELEIYGFSKD